MNTNTISGKLCGRVQRKESVFYQNVAKTMIISVNSAKMNETTGGL